MCSSRYSDTVFLTQTLSLVVNLSNYHFVFIYMLIYLIQFSLKKECIKAMAYFD